MGLRLKEGISTKRYEKLSGVPLQPAKVSHLLEIGMIEQQNEIIIVNNQGVMLLNAVIEALLPD
jgi:oxygen-independent coproporphyrinogen-3 oxidase